MKTAAILVATVAAFAAGLFGIKMFLLPDGAEAAGTGAVELTAADTLSTAEALESVTGLPADSVVALRIPDAPVVELERLRAQIALTQEQLPELLQRLDELEGDLAARQSRAERAKELAGVVGQLEEAELTELLVQLDRRLLADIYAQSSPRGRSKMLRALPARAGAALIEQIASGPGRSRPALSSRAAPRTASADSTAPATGSAP